LSVTNLSCKVGEKDKLLRVSFISNIISTPGLVASLRGRGVPIVVPASSQNHPYSTPRQPMRQEKTPYKPLIYKGLFRGLEA